MTKLKSTTADDLHPVKEAVVQDSDTAMAAFRGK